MNSQNVSIKLGWLSATFVPSNSEYIFIEFVWLAQDCKYKKICVLISSPKLHNAPLKGHYVVLGKTF